MYVLWFASSVKGLKVIIPPPHNFCQPFRSCSIFSHTTHFQIRPNLFWWGRMKHGKKIFFSFFPVFPVTALGHNARMVPVMQKGHSSLLNVIHSLLSAPKPKVCLCHSHCQIVKHVTHEPISELLWQWYRSQLFWCSSRTQGINTAATCLLCPLPSVLVSGATNPPPLPVLVIGKVGYREKASNINSLSPRALLKKWGWTPLPQGLQQLHWQAPKAKSGL